MQTLCLFYVRNYYFHVSTVTTHDLFILHENQEKLKICKRFVYDNMSSMLSLILARAVI